MGEVSRETSRHGQSISVGGGARAGDQQGARELVVMWRWYIMRCHSPAGTGQPASSRTPFLLYYTIGRRISCNSSASVQKELVPGRPGTSSFCTEQSAGSQNCWLGSSSWSQSCSSDSSSCCLPYC